jgi:hypothetical protein
MFFRKVARGACYLKVAGFEAASRDFDFLLSKIDKIKGRHEEERPGCAAMIGRCKEDVFQRVNSGALSQWVQPHEEGIPDNRMALQPPDLSVCFQFLADSTVSCIEGLAFCVTIAKAHPARTFETASNGEPHRTIDRAGVRVPECQADISSDFGRIVNFAVGEQDIGAIWLAAQGKYLSPADLTRALGFTAGVLDHTSDKLMSHTALCGLS